MEYLVASILLLLLLVATIGYLIYSFLQFKKDWPLVKLAWSNTEKFSKHLLIMGGLTFLIIPILKSHPAKDTYIALVTIEVLPAVAGSFFVIGTIAFMKEIQKIRENAQQKN